MNQPLNLWMQTTKVQGSMLRKREPVEFKNVAKIKRLKFSQKKLTSKTPFQKGQNFRHFFGPLKWSGKFNFRLFHSGNRHFHHQPVSQPLDRHRNEWEYVEEIKLKR